MSRCYLGVDAGNSKTVALLADADGRVLGRGRAGVGDIYGVPAAEDAVDAVLDAAGQALAAAGVGTDAVAGPEHEPFLAWCDLAEPLLRTADPSVPGGHRLEPALERYDAAFARRLDVARAARQGHPPLEPVVVRECATCPWWERCRARLDDSTPPFSMSRVTALIPG